MVFALRAVVAIGLKAELLRGKLSSVNMPSLRVPVIHSDLVAAIANAVFPHERHWLDFKEMLYPPHRPGSQRSKSKDDVHDELARDLASLAVRGGYLVFGVHEDKQNHSFTVAEMDLPAQLDQTIDQVARARVLPELYVVPTLVPNPANPSRGLVVVEVPESPLAPHMVGGIYYGRSETGKVQLADDEVERLIQRRGQAFGRLSEAMTATRVAADPVTQWNDRVSHFYLTALPTQPWPDMFLRYTRDRAAWGSFVTQSGNFVATALKADSDRPSDLNVAFAQLIDFRRTQRDRGAWFYSWPQTGRQAPGLERMVGLSDNGAVRYIDLNAGSRPDGHNRFQAAMMAGGGAGVGPGWGRAVIYELQLWWRMVDILRLVSYLAAEANYHGGWLIGVEIDRLRGYVSANHGISFQPTEWDADSFVNHSRTTTNELTKHPREVVRRLLQALFRDLGTEHTFPDAE